MRILCTFLELCENSLDLLGLNRPQIFAVCQESGNIISTTRVDMLKNLHGSVPQFLVLLRQIILDHTEHIFEVDIIDSSPCLKGFINDQA